MVINNGADLGWERLTKSWELKRLSEVPYPIISPNLIPRNFLDVGYVFNLIFFFF